MRKTNFMFLAMVNFLLAGSLISAQTADFETLSMKPGVYQGVSEPKQSEAEALLDARERASRDVAASISSYVTGKYDIQQTAKGTDPANVVVITTGGYSVVVRLPLTGLEEIGRKIEKTGAGYIARVLFTITKEGREKAEKYVAGEAAALRAYHYFAKKFNLEALTLTEVPKGYSDFTSWLQNNCLIFEMREGGNDFLEQLDAFLRKFIRAAAVFTDKLDGKPVKIIYNTPDCVKEIITALQKMNVRVLRENARVSLTPGISLAEFKSQIEKMFDAGKLVIAGISSNGNRFTHMSPVVLNETARIAGQNFGVHSQVVRLPDRYLNGTYNDAEIVNTLDGKGSRYVLLVKSTSVLEPAIEAYRIPPHYRVSYQCILHDSITGKNTYSGTANDVDFSGSGDSGRITVDLAAIVNGMLDDL